ncbi:MAG: hypothetical protein GY696_32155 [Gammaproteobacteria bacterium]|nr:hypothetical protein [Gammaproteobacteria bacterium]
MPHLTRQPEPAQLPNEQLWRAETEELETAGLYSPNELEEWQGKMLFPSYKKPPSVRWLTEIAWSLANARPLALTIFLCTVWLN